MASMPKKRQVFLMVLLLLSGGYRIGHGQDRAADSKPAGHYLNLDGGRIYYEECGAGQSIILLHDGLVHSAGWDGEWKPLCAKFHVIRYDRRGYGRSTLPTAAFDPRADLAALLKHLNNTSDRGGLFIRLRAGHRFRDCTSGNRREAGAHRRRGSWDADFEPLFRTRQEE